MPKEYDNNMRGVLFKNDRASNPKARQYNGSCEIEGTEYRISAWVREGRNGKFLSLSFQEKGENRRSSPRAISNDFDDEDIPF